jgi:inosose dehydratase
MSPIHRREDDALPRASIGTVPILWINAAAADPRHPADAATILDEIAAAGFEGTQYGAGFPQGQALHAELADRGLRLAEVYLPIPATVDGPTSDASGIARDCLRVLNDAGGDVLCAAIDGSADRDRAAGRATDPDVPTLTDAAWSALADLLHEIADDAASLGHSTVFHPHAATFVETPAEIDRLLAETDPDRVGL